MDDSHRFHCDFGRGCTCTIEFSASKDCTGNPPNLRPKVTWTGTKTAEIFSRYMEWIHTVNGVISKIINQQHVFVIQDWSSNPPHWEFWVYNPDGNKKCVQSGEGLFNPAWVKR